MPLKTIILFFILLTGFNAYSQDQEWKGWEAEADTLVNHENFGEALILYSKIIDGASPNYKQVFPVFYKRAVCYYNLNNMVLALKDLDAFMPEDPENLQARLLRAFVYKELGEGDHQIAELSHILTVQPVNRDLLKWRASVYLEKEDYISAMKDLLSAKAIQDDPETEMYLGMTHFYEGHADSALLSLNKAIALDVTFLPPYLYAGSFCLQEEQYELILKYMDVALKIEPGNMTALFYKGIALVELKKDKEGCRCLNKAFAGGEDDAADYLKEYCYGVTD